MRKRIARSPVGFIQPCRPIKAARPPSGPLWIHEIKHDGFRLLVRREGTRVGCFTRGGFDWAERFPAIVAAASRIRAESFLIDGEAIVCGPDGRADFDALRSRRRDRDVVLFAFDLLELKGEDWRSRQLAERRKGWPLSWLALPGPSSSPSTWTMTASSYSRTHVAWAWKASSR